MSQSAIENLPYADVRRWFDDLPGESRIFQKEVAAVVRKSPYTIRWYRDTGRLRAVRPKGQREWEYEVRDVRALLQNVEEA